MGNYLDKTGAQHLIDKIKTLLAGKSNTGHKHTKSEITDFPTIPTVDSALSSSSTNPVQNKVVNTALAGKLSAIKIGTVSSGTTASATASTSGNTTTLNLVLPKGDTGPQGPKGDTGSAGTNATTTSVATTSANGLMSSSDKTKLDGLTVPTNAEIIAMFN